MGENRRKEESGNYREGRVERVEYSRERGGKRERENKVMEREKGEIMERERMRREKVRETENVEKENGRESAEKGVFRRE